MPILYRLKVHASAREEKLQTRGQDAFEVWTRASPQQGRANAAILALLAAHLGFAAKRLRIVKGARAPSKIVAVLGT